MENYGDIRPRKTLMISVYIWIQYRRVTDGHRTMA